MSEVGGQLKKGFIDILILNLLSTSSMYGYQLINELDRRSEGVFKMKEGTLYPVLYRLEDSGYIRSYWEQDTDKRGVPRKYYSITGSGEERLREMNREIRVLLRGIRLIIGADLI